MHPYNLAFLKIKAIKHDALSAFFKCILTHLTEHSFSTVIKTLSQSLLLLKEK